MCLALTAATAASAHGFGQRYDLPLPLPLYLFGAAAAVALSFVMFGLFARRDRATRRTRHIDLFATGPGAAIARSGLVRSLALAIRLAALGGFTVTIVAGFVGDQNPYRNIAPTLVWIIFWVGLVHASALLGNIWDLLNPWRTLFAGAERLYQLAVGGELARRLPYPPALGVWPACLLLLAFAWIELVYPSPAVPAHVALIVTAYTILTLAGMFVFGREAWLQRGEVFSIVFGTFARFAPIRATAGAPPKCMLRPFGAGLHDDAPVSTSMMALVLLLLSSVLYDGLIATPAWSGTEAMLAGDPVTIRTAGLVGFWLLFVGAYLAACAAAAALLGGGQSALRFGRGFALTLVPIAIGYHVAHYLVFLLIQGQYIVPLLSDPFGYGWDLFGTAAYRVDIAIVGARFAWYAALAAIVIGHVAAVYLAHARAMRILPGTRLAMRSQVPLTALMVVYTFIGLSITAEPIVTQRDSAPPAAVAGAIPVPADAVLPEPGDGRLRPVGAEKVAAAKMTYRVLGSLFHDGSRMTIADLLYAYMFAYRWGVRRPGDEAHYDPAIDAATAVLRRALAGVRAVGSDTTARTFRVGDISFVRELLIVDVYLTAAAPDDPDYNAVLAPPWSTLPWHLVVLMEEAVSRGWAAFSQAEAQRRDVDWLDLVRLEPLKRKLLALVEAFERAAYRPDALQSLVSADAARQRWSALAAFYRDHGHFLVTNGPYQLTRWSADSATLGAFRDMTYPLGVGTYDAYAIPRHGHVTRADWDGRRVTLSGDIEIVEKFQRSYRLVRMPLPSIAPVVRSRAAPSCRYTVVDDQGRVVLAGVAPLAEDATFRIEVGGRLSGGRYTMLAVIAVNGNVTNPEIRRIPISVAADR
ncbi:hypothetical protein FHP25_14925 [Vineibacter terrae]|uniref:Uncharacterized protein n=1 Tax=Vineibacter terrae TaxID=2586908 RepID=A0A5C8PMC4_9HYPH|nr:hypothetical protein [Vineibacter terrae]TXL75171.1 hypothetical protein FHP25_14925 [Vineibacter terrae]